MILIEFVNILTANIFTEIHKAPYGTPQYLYDFQQSTTLQQQELYYKDKVFIIA